MFKPRGAFARNAGVKSRAPSTCQKCLDYGHYSYECKASERPYKARPTRTQQLKNPKLMPKLSIDEEPNALLEKTGIADKVLADKEREREKRRRSESVSTYSSGSDSASTYSSSDEEGGERKRVRRDSRSGSSASYSSGRSQSRSQSPEQRGRSKSVDLRDGGVTRDVDSPERRPVAKSPESSRPRRRSSSPRVPTEPARARSRWDQRGPSPRRERSLSPYSRRQQLSRR